MITAAQSVIFQILFLLFSFDLKLSGKNIHLSQTEFSYLGMIPLLTLSFSRRVLVYQDNSVNEKIKLFRRTSTPSQLIFHKSIYLFIYLSNYFNFFNSRFWTYTFYLKSCASEKECQDKNCGRINPGIPNLKIKKCDSACCKTNRCNDGAGISMVSGFTLFTCALLALTRSAISKD